MLFISHYKPIRTDEGMYPLKMVPYELINLAGGWIPNPPYLNKTLFEDQLLKNDSFIEINPATANAYDLKEGDKINIASEKGSVEARVHLFNGAMPDVIFIPMGFGHTAFDDFLRGKGCNPNILITGNKAPLTNQPAWWSTSVRIKKVYEL